MSTYYKKTDYFGLESRAAERFNRGITFRQDEHDANSHLEQEERYAKYSRGGRSTCQERYDIS